MAGRTRLRRGYLLLVYAFLYLPILILIANSFNSSRYGLRWEGWTLTWYRELFGNGPLMGAAVNSLLVAALSATFATALGALGAVALHRFRFRGRSTLQGLLFVAMMSPDIVIAISLLILFIVAHLSLGLVTLLLAHITFCLPFVVITVLSRLNDFDPRLLEAARDLGAGEWEAFRRVILPLAMPAVAAGWLLSFTLSIDDVVVSFFVTGPTFEVLPLRIYSMVRLGVKPEVNALATLLFLLPMSFILLSHFLTKEKR